MSEIRFSTYYDSNMLESVTGKVQTRGIKFRGNVKHRVRLGRTLFSGGILTQAYYDPGHSAESKLIVKSQGDVRFKLSPHMSNTFRLLHFQKTFPGKERAYTQTGGSSTLYYDISSRVTFWIVADYRRFRYDLPGSFRFIVFDLGTGSEVSSGHTFSWGAKVSFTRISHKDLHVVESFHDSLLITGSELQKDRHMRLTLHMKYNGNKIMGLNLTGEFVRSNSLINSSAAVHIQYYLSGRLTKKTYYHLLASYTDKKYRHSTAFYFGDLRDPENQQQNQIFCRLEHFIRNNYVVFLQLNILQNETVYNAVYYKKTLIEFGIKYLF